MQARWVIHTVGPIYPGDRVLLVDEARILAFSPATLVVVETALTADG